MAQSTWNDRELPILEAIAAAEEAGAPAGSDELMAATGLDEEKVGLAMQRLLAGGYIAAEDVGGMGDGYYYIEARLLPPGLRLIGTWPEAADAFLARLDSIIQETDDPDERTKLQKLRDGAADVAKDVLSGAILMAGAAIAS